MHLAQADLIARFGWGGPLHGPAASAFTTGLHAAFYESVSFMVIAAILSAIRGGGKKKTPTATRS